MVKPQMINEGKFDEIQDIATKAMAIARAAKP